MFNLQWSAQQRKEWLIGCLHAHRACERNEGHTSDRCQNSQRDVVIGGAQRLWRLRGNMLRGAGTGRRRVAEGKKEAKLKKRNDCLDSLTSLWDLHWDYISLAFLTFKSHKSETALTVSVTLLKFPVAFDICCTLLVENKWSPALNN